MHCLESFFCAAAASSELKRTEFLPVRGNIPTRVRKLMEGYADGLRVSQGRLGLVFLRHQSLSLQPLRRSCGRLSSNACG